MVRKIRPHDRNREKKLKEREEEKKKQEEKEEKKKPSFNWKSFWIVLASVFIGTMVIPVLFSFVKIPYNVGLFIGNTFIASFGCTWAKFFVESKKGYTKEFWKQYAIFVSLFGVISLYWLFRK